MKSDLRREFDNFKKRDRINAVVVLATVTTTMAIVSCIMVAIINSL